MSEDIRWVIKGLLTGVAIGVVIVAAICLVLMGTAHAQAQPAITPNGIQFPLQNPTASVAAASVSPIGNPGMRTVYYFVVARGIFGAAQPAGPFPLRQAANLYGADKGANVNWAPVPGVLTYDLLKSTSPALPSGACNCAVTGATGLTSPSFSDTTEATASYTVDTANAGVAAKVLINQANGDNTSCLAVAPVLGGPGACIALDTPGTLYYQTVIGEPQEPALSIGAGLAVSDTPGVSTNLSLPTQGGLTPGSYCNVTLNAQGIATGGTPCSSTAQTVDVQFGPTCSTSGQCTTVYNWSAASPPVTWPDAGYTPVCSGISCNAGGGCNLWIDSYTQTTITSHLERVADANAQFANVNCHAYHP